MIPHSLFLPTCWWASSTETTKILTHQSMVFYEKMCKRKVIELVENRRKLKRNLKNGTDLFTPSSFTGSENIILFCLHWGFSFLKKERGKICGISWLVLGDLTTTTRRPFHQWHLKIIEPMFFVEMMVLLILNYVYLFLNRWMWSVLSSDFFDSEAIMSALSQK